MDRDGQSPTPPGPVGLVGLGLVGTALYKNLIDFGYDIYGYDPVDSKRDALNAAGGVAVSSCREIGNRCDVVFLSLLDSEQVATVLYGDDGLLSGTPATTLIIDTTTGSPEATVSFHTRLEQKKIDYLDATISGSSGQIRERNGVFLVGGAPEAYRRVSDLLDRLGAAHFHLGPPGFGSKAKLVSNLILGLNRAALAEGLIFAERLGLDPASTLAVLRKTPAYSVAMDVKGEKMVAGDFTTQSRVSQHRKDLDIILKYADERGQPLPLTQAHHRLLRQTEEDGFGDLDTSAIIKELRVLGDA